MTSTSSFGPFPAAPSLRAVSALRLGYVRLTDAVPLIVAAHRGYFERHGVAATLTPIAAWSSLRDRLAFGSLDAAPVLAPMAIATALGLGGVQQDLAVGATLSRNGNKVVFGRRLLAEFDAPRQGALAGAALGKVIAARRARGAEAPVLAIVFPFSSHNYLLRYWLASAGIDPDRDVRLVVVPPSELPDALADHVIDGFCAGEPWGSRAVDLELGEIVLATGDIWPNHPEKMLAFTERKVAEDRPLVMAALAAVIEASDWVAAPDNADEVTDILARTALADVPREVLAPALAPGAAMFQGAAATYPDPAHGAWWLSQMRAWQHVPAAAPAAVVAKAWQPALWHEAAALVGVTQTSRGLSDPPPFEPVRAIAVRVLPDLT